MCLTQGRVLQDGVLPEKINEQFLFTLVIIARPDIKFTLRFILDFRVIDISTSQKKKKIQILF